MALIAIISLTVGLVLLALGLALNGVASLRSQRLAESAQAHQAGQVHQVGQAGPAEKAGQVSPIDASTPAHVRVWMRLGLAATGVAGLLAAIDQLIPDDPYNPGLWHSTELQLARWRGEDGCPQDESLPPIMPANPDREAPTAERRPVEAEDQPAAADDRPIPDDEMPDEVIDDLMDTVDEPSKPGDSPKQDRKRGKSQRARQQQRKAKSEAERLCQRAQRCCLAAGYSERRCGRVSHRPDRCASHLEKYRRRVLRDEPDRISECK